MSQPKLFEDTFEVKEIDRDGKKFDKVSRIHCKSELFQAELVLDVNFDLYPMKKKMKFSLALATTLRLDGQRDEGTFDQSGEESLADKYEYVMHGKVYELEDDDDRKLTVYVSFGGLLMSLKADDRPDSKPLDRIERDSRVYLLIRKLD